MLPTLLTALLAAGELTASPTEVRLGASIVADEKDLANWQQAGLLDLEERLLAQDAGAGPLELLAEDATPFSVIRRVLFSTERAGRHELTLARTRAPKLARWLRRSAAWPAGAKAVEAELTLAELRVTPGVLREPKSYPLTKDGLAAARAEIARLARPLRLAVADGVAATGLFDVLEVCAAAPVWDVLLAPPEAPPQTDADAGIVLGISREDVAAIVRGNLQAARRCHASALARNPDLKGKVVVAFVITPSGTVEEPEVPLATVDDPALHACLADVVRTLHFPAPPKGGNVKVSYPFLLSRQGVK